MPISMCLYGNRVVSWWRSSGNQDECVLVQTVTIAAAKLHAEEREEIFEHVN